MRSLYNRRLFVNRFNPFMSLLTMALVSRSVLDSVHAVCRGFHAFSADLFSPNDAAARQGGLLKRLSAACSWAVGHRDRDADRNFAGIYLAEYGKAAGGSLPARDSSTTSCCPRLRSSSACSSTKSTSSG
jgi:hypothetical protein